jgi:hypothetical protein
MTEPSWTPEFPGQRPPFEPGNEAALRHGARSERRLLPRAAAILEALRAEPAVPEYLRTDPTFGPALSAGARAEAAAQLVAEYLSDVDVDTLVGDQAKTLELLRRLEAAALTHRRQLGLDPSSRGRLSRDLTASRYMQGLTGSPLTAALDAIDAERRELGAGGGA